MKTQRAGYGLFAALVALTLLICAAIIATFAVTGPDHGQPTPAGAAAGPGTDPAAGAGPVGTRPGGATARAVDTGGWAGTWSAAPGQAGTGPAGPHSVRNVVHTSLGGDQVRITLSNLFGTEPLYMAHASIAVAAASDGASDGASVVPGTLREVLFAGRPSVIVPPGGHVVGDPAPLLVPEDGHLLVTLHVPASGPAGTVTLHERARQTSYLGPGDRTRDTDGSAFTHRTSTWHYLTAVDVHNPAARGAVVAIGDSLTDGAGSTSDTDRRWTDHLADRLRAGRWGYGVLNLGIGGNRLLQDGIGPSGLSRFERDVLDRSGARVVVIELGINDIIRPPRPADPAAITAGLRTLAEKARANGLRVVGTTLMPFEGHRRHTPELEAVREEVNEAVRAGRVFDDVIDFDRAVRDPYAPDRLLPAYDSGDHLHPNDAGYAQLARSVDLAVLIGERSAARL
ncbi:SGNH/GDSL hydrolase family protein [Streptomyces sp. NPDC091376]|uniref:SGNH/GDSL hydrolase family protein n=1 Tax=Streptomyces sp. NPDC091376 TaxID=3365994 RepID=UPI0037F32981